MELFTFAFDYIGDPALSLHVALRLLLMDEVA